MTDRTDALKTLHTRVIDSREGYKNARDDMADADVGAFVDRCIAERESFHATLHDRMRAHDITMDEGGSTAAAAHRGLMDLRGAISSGPSGIYAECARGDEQLVKAYDDAIDATKDDPAWEFLVDQRAKVSAAAKEARALA